MRFALVRTRGGGGGGGFGRGHLFRAVRARFHLSGCWGRLQERIAEDEGRGGFLSLRDENSLAEMICQLIVSHVIWVTMTLSVADIRGSISRSDGRAREGINKVMSFGALVFMRFVADEAPCSENVILRVKTFWSLTGVRFEMSIMPEYRIHETKD